MNGLWWRWQRLIPNLAIKFKETWTRKKYAKHIDLMQTNDLAEAKASA